MIDIVKDAPAPDALAPDVPIPDVEQAAQAEAVTAPSAVLAQMLSRLAALVGEAVPAFRFEMLERGRDGADIAQLDELNQATEMWMACFPRGLVRNLPAAAVQRGDYPLLWLPADAKNEPLMLTGARTSGVFDGVNAAGEAAELAPRPAGAGVRLQFVVKPQASSQTQTPAPESAKEWFRFAVSKHRKVFMEAVLATFVISILGLFTALYTMQVYDRVVPTRGFSTLLVLTIGVALSIAFEFFMKQARSRTVDIASKKIDLELSTVFFGKAMAIRMDARPPTVGTFASQIRHFESVRAFMTTSTLFIMADAPFAILFIGVIAIIGGPVALVPLITVPLAVASSFFFLRRIKAITSENMEESNLKNGLLIEAIDGAESVKASGGEWKMEDRYRELTTTISHSDLEMRTLQSRATGMGQAIQQANYVGMIAVGAFAITEGLITMGALIACSIIAGRALTPIAQIPNLVMQWNQARIALEGLDHIMAMPSDRDDSSRQMVPGRCQGELFIKEASFSFVENQPALELVDVRIAPGERVAIIGAVGSGKSTLIKMLSGLFQPTSGAVMLDDVDIRQLAPQFVREHIGYLPQDVRLFRGTLRDNLTLGLPTPSDSRLLQACQLTGLQQIVTNHPQGLELPIAEGGRGLSGGQRQLVGLTRLLLAQPKVMLLDEPTAAMDNQLEASVMAHLFKEVAPTSSLVVVTHKLALLRHVDRVIVVDQGKRVFDGPKDKVMAMLQQNNKSKVNA